VLSVCTTLKVTSWFKGYLKSLLNNCADVQAEWMAPEVLRNEPSDEK
jgi:hypothetical protein